MGFGDIGKITGNFSKVEQYLAEHGITKHNFMQNMPRVKELLKQQGGSKEMVDKALTWGKGLYKGAKFLGKVPEKYANIDVDHAEVEIRKFLKLDDSIPSYDERRREEFDGTSYSVRSHKSDNLPD